MRFIRIEWLRVCGAVCIRGFCFFLFFFFRVVIIFSKYFHLICFGWLEMRHKIYSHNLWFDVNHVRPSHSPSPDVAHDGWTYQFRSRIRVKPSFSWISCGFIAEKLENSNKQKKDLICIAEQIWAKQTKRFYLICTLAYRLPDLVY